MRKSWKIIAVVFIMALGCKKPFTPDVVSTNNNYLVVEGVINAGNDSTKIKLSRTTKLADTARVRPELSATLYIEDDKSTHYDLKELGNGTYACAPLNLQGQKCRLHIVTSEQKEYVSDYVTVDHTPPVDSISYSVLATGLQFNVYNHDPTNNIRYFRWDFDETWEYVAYMQTSLKYENGKIGIRNATTENIYYCWNTLPSKQILLGSSAGLSNSVIKGQPIEYVDVSSGKIARSYSILLRQYALSKDAYEYWQKLKKNTEQLGSIFDAQPSDLRGNLHSVSNATEPVLGFISASTITTKRILIDVHNTPLYSPNYFPPPSPSECGTNTIKIAPGETFDARLSNKLVSGDSILVATHAPPGGAIDGYMYAPVECADCRAKIKGGTNVRPPYWPDYL